MSQKPATEISTQLPKAEDPGEGCLAFLKLCCCKCTPGANFKSLTQRRPSSLAVLDGMRFMAVLWVFVLHNNMNTFLFYPCLFPKSQFWNLTQNGDVGVDIFFVLSGFLISFVLKKEYDKNGDIDWTHFMKMRFLRIYPAMGFYIGLSLIVLPFMGVDIVGMVKYALPPAFFVNNLVGTKIHKSHLWSIAIEMQFYLFSPWLLKKMIRSDKPWIVPTVICIISIVAHFVILSIGCPETWKDSYLWNPFDWNTGEELEGNCGDFYFNTIYQ